jgi:hypothetical protein
LGWELIENKNNLRKIELVNIREIYHLEELNYLLKKLFYFKELRTIWLEDFTFLNKGFIWN